MRVRDGTEEGIYRWAVSGCKGRRPKAAVLLIRQHLGCRDQSEERLRRWVILHVICHEGTTFFATFQKFAIDLTSI